MTFKDSNSASKTYNKILKINQKKKSNSIKCNLQIVQQIIKHTSRPNQTIANYC